MRNFFKKLLSSSGGEASSKRFNSLAALVMLCGVIVAAILGHPVSDSIIYTLSGLIIGSSALTLAEKK